MHYFKINVLISLDRFNILKIVKSCDCETVWQWNVDGRGCSPYIIKRMFLQKINSFIVLMHVIIFPFTIHKNLHETLICSDTNMKKINCGWKFKILNKIFLK